MKISVCSMGLALTIVFCWHTAGAATIGLSVTQVPTTVIAGAPIPFEADVTNTGSGTLNYSLTYSITDNRFDGTTNSITTIGPQGGTPLGPGATQSWIVNVPTGTSNIPPGSFLDLNWTASAPGASNSPQSATQSITVDAHSVPVIWSFTRNEWVAVSTKESGVAMAPPEDLLAFGATGGGESFAAGAPNIIGDPPMIPTAGLALDSITSVGDAQISTNLAAFADLAPFAIGDENPAEGDPFMVFCDTHVPGTYSKEYFLAFSDEQDLPGANAPGTYTVGLKYTFVVAADNTATYAVNLEYVPEPSGFAIAMLGLIGVLAARRRERYAAAA